jgi:hypothetical protein
MQVKVELETAAFNRGMTKFMAKTNLSADIVLRKYAMDLLSLILRAPPNSKHPVDTGRARAGWYASAMGTGTRWTDAGKDSAAIALGKSEGSYAEHFGWLDKWIEMTNGVDYIVYLEYGHSQQAPAGMVRVSMRQMRGLLPEKLSKQWIKDWNSI